MFHLSMICLSELTIVENEKHRLRTKEDGGMKSSIMQNLSDPETTFWSKAGKDIRNMLPILKNPLEAMVRL